ncbi:nitrous oxide reductase accessory protein NosL [Pseudovibrio sp. JE062]|uniref:nitrous oxide reductase accessory protein NosL n=1 Tax=Pseudovibrio sp. JE062 TaxID=439495 RepID=UPI000186BEBE|nr:nitrous oxide reductase accessory protein NosL [Pseudovibrio sp. JE062]EEA96281.1 NosL protein required for nitrous oxide reduction [Pseudovibrio sp. JE062]
MMKKLFAVVGVTLLLAACQEEQQIAKPAAMELSAEAAGHYCQMTILDHEGPKAQIHLAGNPFPLWFSQIRDAVAFTRLPEESKDYVAIYVNDMDKAESWEQPGNNNWIDADAAFFVIESSQIGGMGAPEAIPFGTKAGAEKFSAENGGKIVKLAEIPSEYVLKPVEFTLSDASDN